ncbi:MAG: trigger factor [Lachnospiraceae bacterium]|nr:trigger factor [Lachnospiraceae bacterium]
MKEDDLLKDAVEAAADTAEEISEEAAGIAEEVSEEAAGIAEEVSEEAAGLAEEAEEAGKKAEEDIFETTEKDTKKAAQKDEKPAASRKTTIVLISIICVLSALIIVFVVYFVKNHFFDKKNSDSDNTEITAGPTSDPDSANSGTADGTGTSSEEPKDYNVTVELGQYKGIEVDFPPIDITDEDVDDEIDAFIEDHTELVPVERASKTGDTLDISFVGYMDGETFDGGTGDDANMVLGDGNYFDAFEEGLVGKEVGEHTLDLVFPDDYYEDLAGKPVTFVVTINSISETVVPELTDQLIADNTEFATIAEYRAYIKGELEEEAAEEAEEDLKNEIIQIAVGNATFGGEIEEEIADLTQQALDYYDQMAQSYYGVSGAELFGAFYGVDEEGYRQMLEEDSRVQTETQHMLEKVAEVEQLTYTEEEYQAEFEDIFYSYYGFTDEAEVREELTEEQIDKVVAGSIKVRKAQDFIIDNAVINR